MGIKLFNYVILIHKIINIISFCMQKDKIVPNKPNFFSNKDISMLDSAHQTQHTKISKYQKFIDAIQPFVVGALSGVCSMFATCVIQPIDMIKVIIQIKSQQQINHKNRISPFVIAKQIYQAEGVRGFYRGLDSALTRQIIYTAIRLGVYKTISDYTKQRNKVINRQQLTFFQKAYCGLTAGFVGSLVANPADLVLIRMQADAQLSTTQRRNYNNVVDAFRRIVRQEGFFGLWRGATPTVIRAMALSMTMLASYDQIKQRVMRYKNITKQTTETRLYASLIAGFLSSFVSLPFDNAKTKMQKMKQKPDGTLPYKNIFDAMAKTIKNQGFTHLWVGLPTFYFRIAPHVFITLVTQDYITDFANKLRGKAL